MGAKGMTGRAARAQKADPMMQDLCAWREEILVNYQLYSRIIWSRGASELEWRVTAQAYHIKGTHVTIVASAYKAWPSRGYKTPEAMMLGLLMELERLVGQPLIGAPAEIVE
jgi:hypothetical protein